MIPKIIHYCWFGGNPLPELALKCIESWKEYCPDYEIMEWNENNFDINCFAYTKEAYESKKWAFVSDVARLWCIYNYGGLYLDTDVEIVRPLDDLLNQAYFVGLENGRNIATGLGFGAEKNNEMIKNMLDCYGNQHFIINDKMNLIPCPTYNTDAFESNGLVLDGDHCYSFKGGTIYATEYFCPKSFETGIISITDNTYTIHHFDGSWYSDVEKLASTLRMKYRKYFPWKIASHISIFIAEKRINGLKAAFRRVKNHIFI